MLQPIRPGKRLLRSMNIKNDKFILCVDDDPDDRLIIAESIKEADPTLAVVEAKNGVEALEILKHAKLSGHFPLLVILDINMPMMDGKETLLFIKQDHILQSLPVVFFSTSSNPKDHSFSTEHGVELVTKPSTYRSMIAHIENLLVRFKV